MLFTFVFLLRLIIFSSDCSAQQEKHSSETAHSQRVSELVETLRARESRIEVYSSLLVANTFSHHISCI